MQRRPKVKDAVDAGADVRIYLTAQTWDGASGEFEHQPLSGVKFSH